MIRALRAHAYPLAAAAGLAAALLGLGFVVVKALYGIGTSPEGLCHDPPARRGDLDPLLFISACAACFAAGHLLSGAGARHRPRLRGRLGEDPFDDRRSIVVVKAAVALLLLAISGLLALEAVMLALHVWPVTFYVRCGVEASGPIALIGGGAYCFLAGRWLWPTR